MFNGQSQQYIQMKNRYYSPNPHSNNYPSLKGQRILNSSGKLVFIPKSNNKQSENRPLSSKSVHLCQSEKKIGAYTYDISKEIGSGFSSIVYKGLNTKTNMQCAIKIINIKKYSDSSIKMLENETKILRALNHPNIIKCLDVYKTNNYYYIITEYCSNGDLLTFIGKNGKLQQNTVKKIMSDIIEGVKYLMSKSILHRDLKPANILNAEDHWKIADFGFAIYNEGQIRTKYNVGTPLYMPLEALVDNIYSPASDIFSIGIIFYEVLTGTTPWESKNQKQLIKKMKTQPYSLPSKIMVSKELSKILEQMCSIDASRRMSKSNFMNLNLMKENINPEQKKNKIKQAEQQKQQRRKMKSQLNFATHLHRQELADTKIQTQNNHILINQLHFCRFIYYFIRNISHLKVSSKNRTKLTLVMFKHLRKLIKLLTEDKINIFKLAHWQTFRQSKKYYSTQITLKQYLNRYEKQYMALLKEADLDLVRQTNQIFPELSSTEAFTKQFYQSLTNFLKPLIRQANHNLTAQGLCEPLSVEAKAGIEALRSLLNHYRFIQILMNNFEQFERFEQQSNIKVQIDYTNSQITLQDYMQLRQKLKFV